MLITQKPGTVLLFPKENYDGIYTFLLQKIVQLIESVAKGNPLAGWFAKTVAKFVVDWLSQKVGHNYIHAEIVLPKGWIMGAFGNGVHIYNPSDTELIQLAMNTHSFVPKVQIDPNVLKKTALRYWNKNYDFASLILNAFVQIVAFGDEKREAELEDRLAKYFENKDALICSELVARIYEDLGYRIERRAEFVTPDDIAQSTLFEKI